ncbi:hypothetical protein FA95DRAFT_70605 [Auriscalpium vulgare]|uniref:Uncharacterized protein n=1 Tax=Auriscalpium vulgare TaxID=40419 RepID=A0ACB8S6M2_9AGAM|nr:hypothetical protein FA95DRAFT_70605 [Auriscalpium vulgare]
MDRSSRSDIAAFWDATVRSRLALVNIHHNSYHEAGTPARLARHEVDSQDAPITFWNSAICSMLVHVDGALPPYHPHFSFEARDIIDSNLHAMAGARSALFEQRNTYLPISRLPSKVLALVFRALGEEAGAAHVHMDGQNTSLGWVSVTHVCRRWRAVAMENHELWTHITFSMGERWAHELVSRWRSAPMILNTISSGISHSDILLEGYRPTLIIENLSRVKYLALHSNLSLGHDAVLEALNMSCPALETLIITPGPGVKARPLALPIPFLGGTWPNLLHLDIVTPLVSFPWESSIFNKLISLTLDVVARRGAPSVADLLDILATTEKLEELRLGYGSHAAQVPVRRVACLRHLKVLHFGGTLAECAMFLSNLQTPRGAHLHFSAREVETVEEYDSFFHLLMLRSHLHCSLGPCQDRVFRLVLDKKQGEFLLRLWCSNDSPLRRKVPHKDVEEDEGRASFHVHINPTSYRALLNVAQLLGNTVVLEDIEDLRVFGSHEDGIAWNTTTWRSILARTERLRKLVATYIVPAGLLEALRPSTTMQGMDAHHRTLLCPNLRSLAVTLFEASPNAAQFYRTEHRNCNALSDIVDYRLRVGNSRLQEIVLVDCSLMAVHMVYLRAVVFVVEKSQAVGGFQKLTEWGSDFDTAE